MLAVKPQTMGAALPRLAALGNGGTVFLSIAAGTPIRALEAALGATTPIVRAMPNTPAAVGRGHHRAGRQRARPDAAALALAETLMQAVGQTVRLEREADMDAVTALSGSGPAYVFLLIEALAAAGEAEGLDAGLALRLARATVAGAGALAESSGEGAGAAAHRCDEPRWHHRRRARDPDAGVRRLARLMRRAVAAAAARSRELGG